MTGTREAPRELLALALAMREDWDRDETWNAILAAKNQGWAWDRIARETWNLLWIADSEPGDLRRAAAKPLDRQEPGPGTYERGAALWREALGIDPGTAA